MCSELWFDPDLCTKLGMQFADNNYTLEQDFGFLREGFMIVYNVFSYLWVKKQDFLLK